MTGCGLGVSGSVQAEIAVLLAPLGSLADRPPQRQAVAK